MEVKRLDWDSNLFGYEIGKILVESGDFNFDDLNAKDDYKLLYVESDVPIGKREFSRPCYAKITFIKDVEMENNVEERKDNLKVEKYSGNLTKQLLSLTYQSGVNSRFKLDENFSNNEFKKLYKKWIENSLNGKIADTVGVVKVDSSKIIGFVTVKFKADDTEIGLIAVDRDARGLGIGSMLLDKVSELTVNRGCEKIFVSTQKENKLACNFYEKNGFKEFETRYVYHWWTEK